MDTETRSDKKMFKGWPIWLPTPGNIIFTLLALGVLLFAGSAGALPFASTVMDYSAIAQTSSSTIAYQGYLLDSGGNPVNETLPMLFSLYNVASDGSPIWSETQSAVPVADGVFSVLLGSVTPLSAGMMANNNDLWLGITIGSDMEMSPRDKLASAPYAMIADVLDGSITASKLAENAVTSDKIMPGAVGSDAVSFNYAASTTRGGPATNATNLSCTGCVGNGHVNFNYAASTTKGGAATDLSCTGCVSPGDIVSSAVTSVKIENNAVSTEKIADRAATSRKVHLTSGSVASDFTDLNTTWRTLDSSSSTISVATRSRILLVTTCDLQINSMNTLAEVAIRLNGTDQPGVIQAGNISPYAPSDLLYKWRGTASMNHLFTVNSGSHTVALRGRTTSGTAHAWRCDYSYVVFAADP